MALIVVADDEPEVRKAVGGILRGAGYEVQEAYDGLSVLDVILEYKPDLVLLDWMLPELSGGEVLQKLRKEPEYKRFKTTPVIVISDFDDETSERTFRRAGADDFVAKRDNLDEFREMLLKRVAQILKARP